MKNAKEILEFYILSGISEIVSECTFALEADKKLENTISKKPKAVGINGIELAQKIALQTQDINELFEKIKSFDACPLKQNSNHTIIGKGNPKAQNMIIIDAPDNDDERGGEILCGASGVFVKNFLKAMKIDEADCFFATFLPWRAPGNRAPTQLEADICKPFLEKQISLVAPKKIFSFGLDVSRILASNLKTINQLREEAITYKTNLGDEVAVIPSLSIPYLLSNPSQKAKLWDFLIKCD